jgi:DAK2 domain fusion protein YloV
MAKGKKATAQTELLVGDGQTLKQMTRSALGWLENNYQTVNALNVFPVPDGDTGTNMLLTLKNAYKEIADATETSAASIAEKCYNGALMGARGNSGVILSQLLLGFAHGLRGAEIFGAKELVQGFRTASQTADNVRGMKPVEGTILTVARDGAGAAEAALEQTQDIREILSAVHEEMKRSVDRTPDLLVKDGEYILKKAGVVDSGGMGLTFIIEGMLRYLNGEQISFEERANIVEPLTEGPIDLSGLDFPYDIQFLLIGENLDINEITATIQAMGDSALVAGDSKLIKVHVHVTNPGIPLGYAAQQGQITDVVVENMRLQYEEFVAKGGGPKLPTEASPVEPPQIEDGTIAVVTVMPGDGLTRICYSLGAGFVISGGQTMNPSTEDIISAVNTVPTDKIIILPNNKNIVLSAEQAIDLVASKTVRLVPTSTIPQGIAALLALDPYGGIDDVVDDMRTAISAVQTGEVTTAVRNVSIDGLDVKEGQVIGLHNDVMKVAGDSIDEVVLQLLQVMGADSCELITLYYGSDVLPRDAASLINQIKGAYPEHSIELQEGTQAHYYYIISAE